MQIEALDIPLRQDEDGTIRIGSTRVTLDVVVIAFDQGATPEEIVQDFKSLRLEEVYSVLTYYLHHRSAVEAYLNKRRQEAEGLRARLEPTDAAHFRARLRSRRRA